MVSIHLASNRGKGIGCIPNLLLRLLASVKVCDKNIINL